MYIKKYKIIWIMLFAVPYRLGAYRLTKSSLFDLPDSLRPFCYNIFMRFSMCTVHSSLTASPLSPQCNFSTLLAGISSDSFWYILYTGNAFTTNSEVEFTKNLQVANLHLIPHFWQFTLASNQKGIRRK
jgi:hypothetical protein